MPDEPPEEIAGLEEIARLAESTAVEAAWSQWAALTPLAASGTSGNPGPAWTIIDPEALVLASLALSPVERRLEDLVAAWAREAGFLMSKPRFKRLSPLFGGHEGKEDEARKAANEGRAEDGAKVSEEDEGRVGSRIDDFALYALEGGDKRWKGWASVTEPDPPPRKKSPGPLRLRAGPALVLRLRAGFGVNAKADLLGMLLGLGGESAGLKEIAEATAYTERMIRTATEEMVLAGLIFEIEGRPSSFYADPGRWAPLLRAGADDAPADRGPGGDDPGRSPIPPWKFWSAAFAFLCDVSEWAGQATTRGWSDYVASSRARDLVESHTPRLQRAGVRLSSPVTPSGERYLVELHRVVERVREWGRDEASDTHHRS